MMFYVIDRMITNNNNNNNSNKTTCWGVIEKMFHNKNGYEHINVGKSLPANYNSINMETDSRPSFLGFYSNPFASSGQRIAMIANFSTSYNVINISYALHTLTNGEEKFADSKFGESICSSAFIVGVIFGQLMGGSLGDAMKTRHGALRIVMALQVIASLGSMLVPVHDDFFKVMALWRLLLGIGCGGVYPLAATLAVESSTTEEERGKLVALTFSTQGIGFLFVPLISQVLISIFSEDNSGWIWRVILGVGCIPGLSIFFLMSADRKCSRNELSIRPIDLNQVNDAEHLHNLTRSSLIPLEVGLKFCSAESLPLTSHTIHSQPARSRGEKIGIISSILQEDNLIKKLCTTAACWFILDLIFYGNTLFTPLVLEKAFGSAETLQKNSRDAAILSCIALPGYFVSVFTIGYQTPIWVQSQGFLLMAVLYAFIGFNFDHLAINDKSTLLLLYGLTFFFSNYGPNTTTFMLPSLTFSPECRSTLNGLCAACGKLGALAGVMVFKPTAQVFGDASVMLICSSLSLLGLFFTRYGVDNAGNMKRKHSCPTLTPASSADS